MLVKFRRLLSVLGTSFIVGVCATACATAPTATIKESSGRLTLADSYIGESYEGVIARATTTYQVEPHCENRKVGLKNSRKAFSYAVCGFNPEKARFAKAPLAEVVYHFIDQKLVRIDVRAQGEKALLDQVKGDMQQVFASRDAALSEKDGTSYEWVAAQRIAGVRAGGGASAGNVHVRLFEQSLSDSAPWLAIE